MTKTKKQLRAEAVERLKMLNEYGGGSFEYAILGSDKIAWRYMDKRDALIYLLTDDANDDSTPEKVVSGSEPCVTPESCRQYADQRKQGDDADCESCDSREKLEADVRKIAGAYNMDTQRHGTERFEHELYCSIIHLLNRQRAIDDSICDECSSDYYEMQEEHDQMLDGIAKLMRLKQPYTFDHDKPLENIKVIGQYIDKLKAERDELKGQVFTLKCECEDLENELHKLTAERDYWKEQFMHCLTVAIRQERGDVLDRLMSYPRPADLIEPYQLVTDEVYTLRDFLAESEKERELYRKKQDERDELQVQADEKWNLYVAEHRRADINAADREMYREATSALVDSITDGLRKVNSILDGKDEGLA